MYAIVDIAGQQFKVEKDKKIYVHRLNVEAGSKVDFDKVLLIDNDGDVKVGTPILKNYIVSASVITHLKGDKVKVFKKKRRKGYQKLNGHRQALTQLLIEKIREGTAKPVTAPKKEEKPKAATVETIKSQEAPVEKKAETKKPAAKKAAEKEVKKEKPVAKKKTETTKTAKTSAPAKKPAAKAAPKKETKPAAKAAAPKTNKAVAKGTKSEAKPKSKEK